MTFHLFFSLLFCFLLLLSIFSFSSSQYACESKATSKNNWHWRGTNLGGWFVLEPWLTPSLFYQFLGAYGKWGDDAPNHVAVDSYSFCKVLGPSESNLQLRRHWKTWVTEEQIMKIAITGADTIRIPVGDWMFIPYEPYIGCYDGALNELNRAIHLCKKYGMKVLLDIHAIQNSQNPFDNSGKTTIRWTSSITFEHVQTAGWIGKYNLTDHTTTVNTSSILYALRVVEVILDLYAHEDTIVGLEALNEPWWMTPLEDLKSFYWQFYQLVQRKAPHWVSVFHDSFRSNPQSWMGFLKNCDNFAFDTHLYEAWSEAMEDWQYSAVACDRINYLGQSEATGFPLIIGEWSLATDNCAMWLNGFNDNIPSYPKKQCHMVPCPPPYMGSSQPGTPVDPTIGPQDPFGAGGWSSVSYGMCPVGALFPNEDNAMKIYAKAQLQAFEITHGQFFWNFRTELEPRWNYLEAINRGWLPLFDSEHISQSMDVCSTTGGFLLAPKEDAPNPLLHESHPEELLDTSQIYLSLVGLGGLVIILLLIGLVVFTFKEKTMLKQSSHRNDSRFSEKISLLSNNKAVNFLSNRKRALNINSFTVHSSFVDSSSSTSPLSSYQMSS